MNGFSPNLVYVLVIQWFVCMYDVIIPLLYVHAQNYGITDLSHFYACRSSTSRDI